MFTISKDSNPNYLAKLVKLNGLKKHPDADRLQVVNIDFQQVITGMDAKDGDIYVYFPVESCINKDFLSFTNSFRDPKLNKDDTKVGFFEEKGRVRAVKLRNEKSCGYIVPAQVLFDWLGKAPHDIDKFINTEFDTIDDKLICEKYVIKTKEKSDKVKQGKKPKVSRLIEGQVHLHVDSENFRKNTHKINPHDFISISYKLHGCLPSFSRVKMWDGSSKKIADIVKGDVVIGFNHETNKFVPSKVINTFRNGKTEYWYKIKKESTHHRNGNGTEVLTCTGNHKIFTKDRGYIEAKSIKTTDKILSFDSYYNLNNKVKEFLIGKIMGDGHIDYHNKKWAVVFGHQEAHLDYINYCKNFANNLFTDNLRYRTSGYGTTMVDIRTHQDESINNLFREWFDELGNKVLPKNLKLTPITLAFWYMDDGSLRKSSGVIEKDGVAANIAICSFKENDVLILKKSLLDYGFSDFNIYKDKAGYYRLRLNNKDAIKLFEDINKYVPPIMRYKLPQYLENKYEDLSFGCEKVYLPKEENIKEINVVHYTKVSNRTGKYDIETETNNFISGGILIHNSSATFQKVLVKKNLTWFEKILKKLGVNINDKEYDLVVTSRKVVKNDNFKDPKNKLGFYGEDIWSQTAKSYNLQDLPNGYSIYGEIVGYTDGGAYVQKPFDYNCNPNEEKNKLYVYRITHTNDKGLVTELTFQQIVEFCERLLIDVVPIFFIGYAKDKYPELSTDWSDAYWSEKFLEKLEEEYMDKDCFMCKNKVPSEGIVIKKEQLFSCEPLKLKSFKFLEYESKQLDTGESDMESEN